MRIHSDIYDSLLQCSSAKTPVSLLQELYVKQGINPKYDLIQIEGAIHEPTFKYRVSVGEVVGLFYIKEIHFLIKYDINMLYLQQWVRANQRKRPSMQQLKLFLIKYGGLAAPLCWRTPTETCNHFLN